MKPKKNDLDKWYITRYSKEMERTFLFYAAIAMFVLFVCLKLFGN